MADEDSAARWVDRLRRAYKAFDEMLSQREQSAALGWLNSKLESEWREGRKPVEADKVQAIVPAPSNGKREEETSG